MKKVHLENLDSLCVYNVRLAAKSQAAQYLFIKFLFTDDKWRKKNEEK